MSRQTTILTSHKGVDLHAATAVRVMRERLDGGDRLLALHRCEVHTFWCGDGLPTPPDAADLLLTGRYYNPNKHFFGHFECDADGAPWGYGKLRGEAPAAGWPGEIIGSDRDPVPADLYDLLLGGAVPADATVVDICAYPLAEPGPVLSAVLWRLVLRAAAGSSVGFAESLAVTRDGGGLLINPHMQGWLSREQQ